MARDRSLVVGALVGVTALAWLYLVVLAAGMQGMPEGASEAVEMTRLRAWSGLDFVLMLLMWVVMMVGMMLPSAAPMILLFTHFQRRARQQARPFGPVAAFVSGYVLVWGGFSLGATLLQWGLERAALLSPMMVSTSPLLGGGLLVAAGLYQWTPAKHACLRHCRSPFQFVMQRWRAGTGGALRMGVEHGAFCLGCCWVLMGLLFFGGVMNLLWIAAIALFVLIEKLAPFGSRMAGASGLVLVLAGGLVITVA